MVALARNWDALCLYAWRPHMYNPQLKHWLHRIAVPTLVLWGASDRIVTPDYGRAYSGLIPGARFEVDRGRRAPPGARAAGRVRRSGRRVFSTSGIEGQARMMFIIRSAGDQPSAAAILIKAVRKTPAIVAGAAGKTDYFCVGEPEAIAALRAAGPRGRRVARRLVRRRCRRRDRDLGARQILGGARHPVHRQRGRGPGSGAGPFGRRRRRPRQRPRRGFWRLVLCRYSTSVVAGPSH